MLNVLILKAEVEGDGEHKGSPSNTHLDLMVHCRGYGQGSDYIPCYFIHAYKNYPGPDSCVVVVVGTEE